MQRARHVEVDVPEWRPSFDMNRDGVERVIAYVRENAIKHSPGNARIEISAQLVNVAELEILVIEHATGGSARRIANEYSSRSTAAKRE
jgi:K+-sensing histidine kinase KdpD